MIVLKKLRFLRVAVATNATFGAHVIELAAGAELSCSQPHRSQSAAKRRAGVVHLEP